MNPDAKVRKLHARIFARRNAPENNFLLSHRDFRFAADCERMRVDRNGSLLSLLFVRLPAHKSTSADIAFLARVLEGRLRVTDTPGLLDDGRIAVLLPDTSADGAWKVAADVSEVYPPGPERPECDVLVYPPHGRDRNIDADAEGEAVAAPEPATEGESSEFFFARAMPWWKRTLDLGGAMIGLAVSAPIVLTAAAAIKATSRGPAFFVQEREGRGGRRFKMWKLRTMHLDAEDRKARLREQSHQDGPAFKMHRDPRTTRLGRFLRATSIDELPQFWNVVRGEMSLVGPRPLPTEESQACEGWHRRRLDMTPGMTCIWQVSGRGKVRFDDWVRMDLRYSKKQNMLHDIKLVLCTIPSLIFQRGMR